MEIKLTIEQINLVLAALAKQPIEIALDTFNAIKGQAEKQLKTED